MCSVIHESIYCNNILCFIQGVSVIAAAQGPITRPALRPRHGTSARVCDGPPLRLLQHRSFPVLGHKVTISIWIRARQFVVCLLLAFGARNAMCSSRFRHQHTTTRVLESRSFSRIGINEALVTCTPSCLEYTDRVH